MKNSFKLVVIAVFGVFVLGLFLSKAGAAGIGLGISTPASPSATPPRANANVRPANTIANKAANKAITVVSNSMNTNAIPVVTPPAANVVSNANAAKPPPPAAGGKTIPKTFALSLDSQSEYGEAPFDHDNHAFKPYTPDGKSVMGCVECHHTDQPKSALKLPLVTSERDVTMTFETWKASPQKVTDCRVCHFQDGNVPDGKEMPTATYTDGGKSTTKDLNNQLAYHINCNTCHDAAAKLRPELKKLAGFATGKDCAVCHKTN